MANLRATIDVKNLEEVKKVFEELKEIIKAQQEEIDKLKRDKKVLFNDL